MRRAGQADAAAIRALTRAVYAKWIDAIGREPRPMTADYERAVRDHWIDLLEGDGELLALIEMIPAADYLWIQNIAVGESRQGSGLGRLLLEHAEEIARQSGLREIRLNTNAAFAANLAIYLHMGFREASRELLPDGGTMVCFTKPVS
jgi:GNAT superfamily N-acetyltransferase